MNFKKTLKKIANIVLKKDISIIIDKKANSPENLKKLEEIILKKAQDKISQQTYRGLIAVVSILWKSKGEKIIAKAKEKTSKYIKNEFAENNFKIKTNYVSGNKVKINSYEFFVVWKHDNEEFNFVNFKLDENNNPDEKSIVYLEGYEVFVKEIKKLQHHVQ